MENTFSNTVVSTNAKGETSNWYFNADNTYSVKFADGHEFSGTWHLAGDKVCNTPNAVAGQPAPTETCVDYIDGKTVGDNWTIHDNNGGAYQVSIKAGR
jgi:hypothetical protein